MATQIQLRHDTAANWTATNPTLMVGEAGVETDTGRMKIGDGATAWTGLAYYGGGIAATLIDAKGDLLVGSAADTVARQAVGANDTALLADSAQANGVKWGTIPTAGLTARAVTAAKLFAASATSRILARITAGSGDWEEATIAQLMALNPAVDVQTYTSGSGTWSKPAGARYVWVRVVGGGGGGGGCASTASGERAGAAGGGGGGYAEKIFAASALGSTEAYAVGAAGAAGAAGNNNGGTGGTSSFGTAGTLVQATGGTGGDGSAASSSTAATSGYGTGGTGSGGNINAKGGAGGIGQMLNGNSYGGQGGNSRLGNGGPMIPTGTGTGAAGEAYGGGGSGAANPVSAGTKAGGAGAAGLVIVITFP